MDALSPRSPDVDESRAQLERTLSALDELSRRVEHLTAPPEDPVALRLTDLFDLADLQRIQDAFAAATGVASIIVTPEGLPLTRPSGFCRLCRDLIRGTEKGAENCRKSDAALGCRHTDGPFIQPCLSGGLLDAGTTIRAGEVPLANWMIGQVRDDSIDEARLLAYADTIGADRDEFRAALSEVPRMSREQFGRVADALHLLGNQLSLLALRNVQQARFIAERQRLEDKLVQARNLETVGQLAGGLAHDFNNLLTTQFMHLARLLRRTDLDEDAVSSLRALDACARQAAQRTEQLLAFSGRQILQTRPIDLSSLVRSATEDLRHHLGERIELHLSEPGHPLVVVADAAMFHQVLVNLALNAREAMPQGGAFRLVLDRICLTGAGIQGRPSAREGVFARLVVSDQGPGIPPAVMARLFEPFFTTKTAGKGVGLGLATVHGVLRQHGGWIEARSEPGRGAEFVLFLPLLADEIESTHEASPSGRDTTALPRRPGEPVLLVVEDEESVRSVVVTILEMLGYRVLAAADGPEALVRWSRHRDEIDLLFTDMVMPGGIDGRELASRILAERPDLPVILSSGYSRDLVRDGLPQSGIHFLEKPYEISQVTAALRQALGDLAPPEPAP